MNTTEAREETVKLERDEVTSSQPPALLPPPGHIPQERAHLGSLGTHTQSEGRGMNMVAQRTGHRRGLFPGFGASLWGESLKQG